MRDRYAIPNHFHTNCHTITSCPLSPMIAQWNNRHQWWLTSEYDVFAKHMSWEFQNGLIMWWDFFFCYNFCSLFDFLENSYDFFLQDGFLCRMNYINRLIWTKNISFLYFITPFYKKRFFTLWNCENGNENSLKC